MVHSANYTKNIALFDIPYLYSNTTFLPITSLKIILLLPEGAEPSSPVCSSRTGRPPRRSHGSDCDGPKSGEDPTEPTEPLAPRMLECVESPENENCELDEDPRPNDPRPPPTPMVDSGDVWLTLPGESYADEGGRDVLREDGACVLRMLTSPSGKGKPSLSFTVCGARFAFRVGDPSPNGKLRNGSRSSSPGRDREGLDD